MGKYRGNSSPCVCWVLLIVNGEVAVCAETLEIIRKTSPSSPSAVLDSQVVQFWRPLSCSAEGRPCRGCERGWGKKQERSREQRLPSGLGTRQRHTPHSPAQILGFSIRKRRQMDAFSVDIQEPLPAKPPVLHAVPDCYWDKLSSSSADCNIVFTSRRFGLLFLSLTFAAPPSVSPR